MGYSKTHMGKRTQVIYMDTTIRISKEFHTWLTQQGNKGESYEKIIKRLIK